MDFLSFVWFFLPLLRSFINGGSFYNALNSLLLSAFAMCKLNSWFFVSLGSVLKFY